MSMLTIGHNELANQRKLASDIKESNSNGLTYDLERANFSRAIDIDHQREAKNIDSLCSCSDTKYFNDLMKGL